MAHRSFGQRVAERKQTLKAENIPREYQCYASTPLDFTLIKVLINLISYGVLFQVISNRPNTNFLLNILQFRRVTGTFQIKKISIKYGQVYFVISNYYY